LTKVVQDTDNKISKENNKQLYYGIAVAEYGLGNYKSVVDYCDKALEITYFDDMNNDILYTQALAANYLNDTKKMPKQIIRRSFSQIKKIWMHIWDWQMSILAQKIMIRR